MSREILFRGKRIDNGEWVKGDLLKLMDGFCVIPNICHLSGLDDIGRYVVDPATVGQFTGLTDKNGVKIFEGDVMRDADTGHVKTVEYHAPRFVLVDKDRFFDYSHWDEHEIIGNIHDNPELMEESE